jgi:hypothetical protein
MTKLRHVICVRARKRSDTILESKNRYYRITNELKLNEGWRYYVLERVIGAAQQAPLFRVKKVFKFPPITQY